MTKIGQTLHRNSRREKLAGLDLRGNGSKGFLICALISLALFVTHLAFSASKEKARPAKLKISGYGILGNRELKRILRTLELAGAKPSVFGASFIEDSALILDARVKRDGYLKPDIQIRLQLEGGETLQTTAAKLVDNPLPKSLRCISADFKIRKGVLYHYEQLEIKGLEALKEKQARNYFMETAILLHPKSARVYTPERLKGGISSLADMLERDGYEQATVKADELNQNDKTGGVTVKIAVDEGVKSVVQSVQEQFEYDDEAEPSESKTIHPNKPFSKIWTQDFTQELKTNLFHRGYPDTAVELKRTGTNSTEGVTRLDFIATVKSGPKISIGEVEFRGEKRTKLSLMSRRARVKRGELLDRIKVEEGRYRLAQIGSFETVDLTYHEVDDHTRDVIYRVKEGKVTEFSLLFGYGSYELLRAGFELDEFNIWGLGHHARLKAIQSFKASSGDFTYTIPEWIGKDLDLFFNASGLRREEISFTRLEYGGGFGAHKYFKDYSTDANLRYSYQILNASEVPGVISSSDGSTNITVGAIILDLKHDRRDNPLYPRKGYRVFVNLEVASDYLGGEANYDRLEISTAWHHPLGGGRYLGLGLSHGLVLSTGDPAHDLPFNRRFFPGGENSIRGYAEGEASPRDAQGKIVGAETYTLGTVELEQALTTEWSLVLFSDSIGFAQRAANYPFDTGLFSVGGGVRWKTIIGPVRLEYGYNLNPRRADPVGTLLFSLGFPF